MERIAEMTHDFKEALEGMTIAKQNGLVTIYGANIDAIIHALRIADRLMGEPSGKMALAVCDIYERTDTEAKVMAEQAKYDFKVMRDHMLKEIKDGN